jgi:hypothetical protein
MISSLRFLFVNLPKSVSQMIFVGHGFSRGIELPENLRFCSANLQVGILESSGCPPEGGRYINQTVLLDLSDS